MALPINISITSMVTINSATIILALMTAVTAGAIGSFALLKRMTLAGDVMSHITLPGFGLALVYHFNPLLGGAATLLLGAVLIWRLEGKTSSLATETAIGVIFAASVAVGTLLTPEADLIEALFGGFPTITLPWLIVGVLANIAILAFLFFMKDQLVLSIFSPELAGANGVKNSRLNLLFLLCFSVTVLLGLQFLGALLVGALIIIPAAVGRQLTHTLGAFIATSSIIGFVSVALGLFASASWHVPTGPAIISIAALLFVVSLLKPKH